MPDGPISNDRIEALNADIDRDLHLVATHAQIAHLYHSIADEAGLEHAVDDIIDRLRSVRFAAERIGQERRSAELTRQVAIEIRNERNRFPRRQLPAFWGAGGTKSK